MTNNEKALELVQKCLDDCPYAATRVIDIMKRLEQVKALLKEQEAKPVIVTIAYGKRFYHCPKCNRDLYAYIRQRYCSNCGQKVKWE